MSDRYETPSWDDEPDVLETQSPAAGGPEAPVAADEQGLADQIR